MKERNSKKLLIIREYVQKKVTLSTVSHLKGRQRDG